MITALGADRPGIVNTITRHVSSCGNGSHRGRSLAVLVCPKRIA
ncbi:ACT domain-containing protein [Methylobacterium haplocladii]